MSRGIMKHIQDEFKNLFYLVGVPGAKVIISQLLTFVSSQVREHTYIHTYIHTNININTNTNAREIKIQKSNQTANIKYSTKRCNNDYCVSCMYVCM
jgi:hypothetical protein